MTSSGRQAHVGISKQTAWGTPVAAAAYLRFRSESLTTSIEEITPPNILGVPDEGQTYQGFQGHAGDIVFDAHPDVLGYFLLSGLGPVTSTGQQDSTAIQINVVATAKTYTRVSGSFVTDGFQAGMTVTASGFTNGGNNGTKVIQTVAALVITMTSATGLVDETGGGDERLLGGRFEHVFTKRTSDFSAESYAQPMTFEIHRDLGTAFQFSDAVVNRLTLNFGVGEKVTRVTAGIIAKTVARITATSPTFEATQAFRYNQAAITLPDPTAYDTLRDLEISIDNGLQPIELMNQTTEAARILAEGSRIVTVGGSMITSSDEWDVFRLGTERALKAVLTGATLGTGTYKLTLEVPKFRYVAYDLGVGGPGLQFVGFRSKGKYDGSTAASPLKLTLQNGWIAY